MILERIVGILSLEVGVTSIGWKVLRLKRSTFIDPPL